MDEEENVVTVEDLKSKADELSQKFRQDLKSRYFQIGFLSMSLLVVASVSYWLGKKRNSKKII